MGDVDIDILLQLLDVQLSLFQFLQFLPTNATPNLLRLGSLLASVVSKGRFLRFANCRQSYLLFCCGCCSILSLLLLLYTELFCFRFFCPVLGADLLFRSLLLFFRSLIIVL